MIKSLIKDLAYDKITLSQGLTRTKLVQSKLKVEELGNWLTSELNGYRDKDGAPDYRKIQVKIIGDFVGAFGQQWRNTPLILDQLGKELDIDFYDHTVLASIKAIEDALAGASKDDSIMIPFGQIFVTKLADLYRRNDNTMHLMSAGAIILPSQYRVILEQTKQRLLDTLLELDEKFPSMNDDFVATKESKEQAKNIVNYHIYGGSNNTNLGVGDKVVIRDNVQEMTADLKEFSELLKRLNVPTEEVESIKQIVTSNEPKQSKFSKAMKWIGQLSTKMITKGIELKLPEIIEATEKMINQMNG